MREYTYTSTRTSQWTTNNVHTQASYQLHQLIFEVYSFSTSMKLFASILVQMCFLGTVFMQTSENSRCSDDEDLDWRSSPSRQAPLLCGRRPAVTSKRAVEKRTDSDEDISEHLDKILGGSYATVGEFPWQANIYVNGEHECGGAIISKYWVLTAAECFVKTSYPLHIKLVLGDHSLIDAERQQCSYRPEHVFVHQFYNPHAVHHNADYNIALIKIPHNNSRGITFNRFIQPICLPAAADHFPPGAELVFSGWGRGSQTGSNIPTQLKKVSLPILDQTTCKSQLYPGVITERMFCAGAVNGDTDACFGDGGGPAAYKSGGVYILVGIMSAGTGCSPPNYPVVFANVSLYLSWIYSMVEIFSEDGDITFIPSRT